MLKLNYPFPSELAGIIQEAKSCEGAGYRRRRGRTVTELSLTFLGIQALKWDVLNLNMINT